MILKYFLCRSRELPPYPQYLSQTQPFEDMTFISSIPLDDIVAKVRSKPEHDTGGKNESDNPSAYVCSECVCFSKKLQQ